MLVDEIIEGGPAARGGIISGDVVMGIEGFPILTLGDFGTKMRDFTPGSSVTLDIWREKKRSSATITAGEIPESFAARVFDRQLGARVTPLPSKDAKAFGVDASTTVRIAGVREKSAAKRSGLEAGDIITHVEEIEVKDPQRLLRAVLRARRSGQLTLKVRRGEATKTVRFSL